MKMRSVSFSDDPQPPNVPPNRNTQRAGGTYTRKQNSVENLPLYDTDPFYGGQGPQNSRLNSLPRMMPHHRRKILETNRPSSSLAGIVLVLRYTLFWKLYILNSIWKIFFRVGTPLYCVLYCS